MTEESNPFPEIQVIVTDAGHLIAFNCMHPEAEQERPDLVLDMVCDQHWRSVYYCGDLGKLWCDGGAPQWLWHEFSLLALHHPEEDR